MKFFEKVFYCIIISECSFTALSGILCIGWIICKGSFPVYQVIYEITILSVIIALLLIPIETGLFYFIRKSQGEKTTKVLQNHLLYRIYSLIPVVFAAIWVIHMVIFDIVVKGAMGIEHASSTYMLYSRPGNYILLSSGLVMAFCKTALEGREND